FFPRGGFVASGNASEQAKVEKGIAVVHITFPRQVVARLVMER
ncbi:MAG: hypothetical protein QOE14_519, partial [Humisphaera sp.]|nr:hypothetical protein [Humisphaera sp.]